GVLGGAGLCPEGGEVVQFGSLNEVSVPARILGIEAAEDMAFQVTLVNDAPELDALAEAHEISEWSPIVGTPSPSFAIPDAPEFNGIEIEDGALIVAAKSQGRDALIVGQIRVDHRLVGSPTWSEDFIAGNAGTVALIYSDGAEVELRLTALNLDTVPGASGPVLTFQFNAQPAPLALDEEAIRVTGGLGHAALSFVVSDVTTASVMICRVPDGAVLDRDLHEIATVPVTPGLTTSVIDGDATRQDLLEAGQFDSTGAWVPGAGWSIASGSAAHSPGVATDLSQALALIAGKTYRLCVELRSFVAGAVTPGLTGGASVSGAAITAGGQHLQSVAAGAGNDTFTLVADAGFDGALEAVHLYTETASCAPQGQFAYVFIPLDDEDDAGPQTSAFVTTIK
ncbi:MAG: hypothetical protein ACRBB0_26720, partial [Pelagimonas sp.]|uniref:hypothetical protein n=1 Tax=Pelagimonas sp. TaxID=2073170 RepID=UPI003D6AA698